MKEIQYLDIILNGILKNESGFRNYLERKKCKYGFTAECISYGERTGLEIINQLLVDHGIQDLGHREICLADGYKYIGVKTNKHKNYDFFAILDFD